MLYQRDFVFNVGAASVNKSSTLSRRVAWDPGGPRAADVIVVAISSIRARSPSPKRGAAEGRGSKRQTLSAIHPTRIRQGKQPSLCVRWMSARVQAELPRRNLRLARTARDVLVFTVTEARYRKDSLMTKVSCGAWVRQGCVHTCVRERACVRV